MSSSQAKNHESIDPQGRTIMPPGLMRLEQRIVLDAAGIMHDAADSSEPYNTVDPSPGSDGTITDHTADDTTFPGQEGADPAEQADPEADVARSAVERTLAALLERDGPSDPAPRILAISSSVEQADVLAEAAADGVQAMIFDGEQATLDGLLDQIGQALNGRLAESIALGTHGSADGGFALVGGRAVNLESLQDPEMQAFWKALGAMVGPGGRIDLLACDAAATPEGQALVDDLENLTGVNFAASVNITGNVLQGADWILETDQIMAGAIYFDGARLADFDEVLDNQPTITDTDPGNTAAGAGAPVVVDAGITIDDGDGGGDVLRGAAVRIQSGFQAAEDRLSFDSALATGFGIAGSYNGTTGELILSGAASAAQYQQVLRTVTYENTSAAPDTTTRQIIFVIGDDFDGYSYYDTNGHYYQYVNNLVNWTTADAAADASTLGGLQGYLATITSAGENTSVTGIVAGATEPWLGASDAATEGDWFWVSGPEAGTQFWQGNQSGTVIGGMYENWNSGEPNDSSDSDYARILSTGMWRDQQGVATQRYLVEYGSMGSDAEGQLVASVMINVIDPNDAPVLDNSGDMSLSAVNEDDIASGGTTVANIISSAGGDRITDADAGCQEGIAIIGLDGTVGTWQFSTDGGTTWNDTGAVAGNNALLLRDTDLLRFQPTADWNGTVAAGVTFRAWDQTSGASGTYVDATGSGGTTAFSTAVETASLVVNNVNDLPTVANLLVDQAATEDAVFTYQFASNAFSDIDPGDALTYSATLSGGNPLPGWLSFNAATRTFSGTPGNDDVGTISVVVTADDGHGGSITDTFLITATNVNDAPTLSNPLVDQAASEDAVFTYQFAPDTFDDVDPSDTITYSATLVGGGPLPGWLSFNAATRTFSGTPVNGDVGTLGVVVTADDGRGGSITDTFTITVTNVNDAPTLSNPLVDQEASENVVFTYHFTPGTFDDVDPSDTITYSAGLVGGGPLPAWLNFDAATRTFSGTPGGGDAGTIGVVVTADDGRGGAVSDDFVITVTADDQPVEPAPPNTGDRSGATTDRTSTTATDSSSGPADDGGATTADDGGDAGSDGGDAADGGEASDAGDSTDAGDAGDTGDAGGEASSAAGEPGGDATGGASGGGKAGSGQGTRGGYHREDEEESEASQLNSQISNVVLSGDLLDDESQPQEFRAAWNTILGAWVGTGEEISAYLESAFRAVTESALVYQGYEQSVEALDRELSLAVEAGLEADVDDLRAEANSARDAVKMASEQLEQAILSAAQAGKNAQFDRVLEDVVAAALQRLMTANDSLYIETQALTAVVAVLRDGRVTNEAELDAAHLAEAVAEARLEANEVVVEMRKSWDRAAQDVFSAFVERLAAERGQAGQDPESS